MLLGVGAIVSWILTYNQVTQSLADLLVAVGRPRVFMLLVVVVLSLLGMLMDAVPIMIALAPLLAPIAQQYGISDVQFGLVFVVTCLIGLVTPPVGIILFMTSSIANVTLEPLSLAVLPFVIWMTIVVILMVFFPSLTLVAAQARWASRLDGGSYEARQAKYRHDAPQLPQGFARSVRRRALRWLSAPPAIGQAPKTLRFGHMLPPTRCTTRRSRCSATSSPSCRANKFKVEIFPSSQMGSIAEMLQSVQAGSLSMSMAVPAWYSSFMKPLDAFTLPYLVGIGRQAASRARRRHRREITKYCEGAGFKVIGYWLLGGRHIVNKLRAVNKPDDCQGLKLRVINSPVYLSTFRALGANPVAMDPSELYLAMQQGVVDGFEFPLPDLVAQKLYEVAKFVSLDQHTTDFFIVSTSQKFWTACRQRSRGWINAAMKTAMDWQWKEQPAEIDNALAKLRRCWR